MRVWRILLFFFLTSLSTLGQPLLSAEEAVIMARAGGFLHQSIYRKANAAANEMAGNKTLDPLEFEFFRGEFNGPYPSDYQALVKQNFGNVFDQIYLGKWNKSRRENIEAQMNLELARADVAVEQAFYSWQSALYLSQWIEQNWNSDSITQNQTPPERWEQTKTKMEVQARLDDCSQQLKFLTGQKSLEPILQSEPQPMLRFSIETQAKEYSLIASVKDSELDTRKWADRYAFSQKLPNVWLGYYQLAIADEYGFEGQLVQLDIPWTSWFERDVKPISTLELEADQSEFEIDQRKAHLVAQFERFESEWLPEALLIRAESMKTEYPPQTQFNFIRDYVDVVLTYNLALIEWRLAQQL